MFPAQNLSMSPDEIEAWIASLGRTPEQRLKVIKDLLHFASSDDMTFEDRAICVEVRELLKERVNASGSITHSDVKSVRVVSQTEDESDFEGQLDTVGSGRDTEFVDEGVSSEESDEGFINDIEFEPLAEQLTGRV